jgi:hypothetical protein
MQAKTKATVSGGFCIIRHRAIFPGLIICSSALILTDRLCVRFLTVTLSIYGTITLLMEEIAYVPAGT